MYSLTFRVRVTTTPLYGRNGTASLQSADNVAHAAGASILSLVRACVRALCVRWAWPITAGLCHAFLVLP